MWLLDMSDSIVVSDFEVILFLILMISFPMCEFVKAVM